MGLIFTQRGLAIEHGSSWMLPRIIGVTRAMELAVTGRLVDAQEALAIGLVNRVVPHDKLMETAREVAGHIASKCSPLGVSQAKKMIWGHLFTDLGHRNQGRRRLDADDDEVGGFRGRRESVYREALAALQRKIVDPVFSATPWGATTCRVGA